MFILKITVPIDNYAGDGVFDRCVYFQCEKSPTKAQVIRALQKRCHETFKMFGSVEHELEEVISVINLMDDWCWVSPNGIVITNTYVEHPKWGTHPVSFYVIFPEIIE